jgi:hypothetical protein
MLLWGEGFFFFFLGFEQDFAFAKQALYLLSHKSSSFFSGFFGDGVWL